MARFFQIDGAGDRAVLEGVGTGDLEGAFTDGAGTGDGALRQFGVVVLAVGADERFAVGGLTDMAT